jgi:hypothetical protein
VDRDADVGSRDARFKFEFIHDVLSECDIAHVCLLVRAGGFVPRAVLMMMQLQSAALMRIK